MENQNQQNQGSPPPAAPSAPPEQPVAPQPVQPVQAQPMEHPQAMPLGTSAQPINQFQSAPPNTQGQFPQQVSPNQQMQPNQQVPMNNPAGKSKVMVGVLGIFFGGFGVHNFILGHTKKAILQLSVSLGGWVGLSIIGGIIGVIGASTFNLGMIGFAAIIWMIVWIPGTAMSIWGLVEAIQILVSKPGSKWHQDARGIELND